MSSALAARALEKPGGILFECHPGRDEFGLIVRLEAADEGNISNKIKRKWKLVRSIYLTEKGSDQC
jgi:hypothetical protein